jgi:hypothetical protein
VTGKGIERLMPRVFDQIQILDILRPVECIRQLGESYFDLSVNCAEIPGAETINILATREKGTVLFANLINNQKNVVKFWDKYEKEIYDFFRPENRSGRKTVVVSASPAFLIDEIAKRMKVDYCIASTFGKRYTMVGDICRKEEKVVRLAKQLPNIVVKDVYSDSVKSDKYIFNLGERCFLATNGVLTEIDKPSLD